MGTPPNNSNLNVILPVASAIAVLILTQMFQVVQKKTEYKRALLTVWFQKKVNAAQAIVAYYNLILEHMVKINVTVKKLEHEVNYDSMVKGRDFDTRERLKRETEEMKKATNIDQLETRTVSLFFGVDETKTEATKDIITKFYPTVETVISRFAINTAQISNERMEFNRSVGNFISVYDELTKNIYALIKLVKENFESVN
jgi:hypothetical protein